MKVYFINAINKRSIIPRKGENRYFNQEHPVLSYLLTGCPVNIFSNRVLGIESTKCGLGFDSFVVKKSWNRSGFEQGIAGY